MIEQCAGCDHAKKGYSIEGDGCSVYAMPERQHSRKGGCAMRTHNRTKAVEERAFVDPLKLSKQTQRGVKS